MQSPGTSQQAIPPPPPLQRGENHQGSATILVSRELQKAKDQGGDYQALTPQQQAIVAKAREKGVKLFRTGKLGWDAPDHHASPWYNVGEWDDEGNYYGPPRPMFPKPIQKGESIQPPEADSPDTDSPPDSEIVGALDAKATELLMAGGSIREVSKATGLTIGRVQRIKAKLGT